MATGKLSPRGRRILRWSAAAAAAAAAVIVLGLPVLSATAPAAQDNGFDLSNSLVPRDQIHHGGPPRDGIPAIDDPRFLAAAEARFLRDDERVLGMVRGGVAKAYPIGILNYHEIVNDRFGDEPVVVSYCPLCGTGMAFSAVAAGKVRRFGVSGLLYNSDVLLYDRESESLWSQIMKQAVTGPLRGSRLVQLPLTHTTWRDWRERHPASLVLSTDTGHRRDYSRTPYAGYETSPDIYFPVGKVSRRYHPKELVIGLTINDSAKVYPFAELSRGQHAISDTVGGQPVRIEFDAANRTGRVLDSRGRELPSVIAYWFAWMAFHPDSAVYQWDGPPTSPSRDR
jgi:hypothetical protein